MAIPYVAKPYDNSGHAARMSDLIRAGGASRAAALRRDGENTAQLVASLTQTAAGTMADLIRARQNAPLEKLRTAQADRLIKDEQRAAAIEELAKRTRGLPPAEAAKAFDEAGFSEQAAALRQQAQTMNDRDNAKQFGELASVYGQDQPDEVVRQGMTVAPKETMAWEKQRAELDEKSAKLAIDRLTKLPYVQTTAAKVLSSPIADQSDLDARRGVIAELADMVGAPKLLDGLSPTFGEHTETERARAMTWLEEQKAPTDKFSLLYHGWKKQGKDPLADPKGFLDALNDGQKDDARGVDAYLAKKRQELGRDLTSDEIRSLTVGWESSVAGARRDPKDRTSTGATEPSRAQIGAAERWKSEQLADLEKRFSAGVGKEREYGGMTKDDLDREKLRIENSYRTQLGYPPVTNLGPEWGSSAPGATPATQSTPSLGSLARPPQPSTPATPTPAQTTQPAPSTRRLGEGPVSIRLPTGELVTFPSRTAAEAFAREAGFTLK